MPFPVKSLLLATAVLAGSAAALAQPAAPGAGTAQASPAQPSPVQTNPAQAPVNAPAPGGSAEGAQAAGKLVLFFGTGSDALDEQNQAILDKASRLYREGRPIIMIVSGSTDSVGDPVQNLLLSQRRADAVARGLLARGIPAERTQILAKGETNPAVETPRGTPEAQNRRVEITWR
jgi:OOP family OmpA-OmpF porin